MTSLAGSHTEFKNNNFAEAKAAAIFSVRVGEAWPGSTRRPEATTMPMDKTVYAAPLQPGLCVGSDYYAGARQTLSAMQPESMPSPQDCSNATFAAGFAAATALAELGPHEMQFSIDAAMSANHWSPSGVSAAPGLLPPTDPRHATPLPRLHPSPGEPLQTHQSCLSQLGQRQRGPRKGAAKGKAKAAPHASDSDSEKGEPSAALIWVDVRAFKDIGVAMKTELEARTQAPVKAHKSAEKCLRLLRKKKNSLTRPPSVFLISWACVTPMLQMLRDEPHMVRKVIVLADQLRGRRDEDVANMKAAYPFLISVTYTWQEAIDEATISF